MFKPPFLPMKICCTVYCTALLTQPQWGACIFAVVCWKLYGTNSHPMCFSPCSPPRSRRTASSAHVHRNCRWTGHLGHRWIFCHSVPGISRDPPDPLRSEAPISKTRFLACGGAMLLRRCFFAKAAGINKKAAAGAAVERFECIATRKSRGQKGTQIHSMLVY